ncbi:hypothetical protein BN1723_003868 [Verticillium longisporum]|uniref:AB hydrolase-1 domain-containing protein n=1 Tax=Verticillium longisporum TaxID=100787 RepID=A0A0G4MDG1_VERLO|nr:hypothetical protein BN1723_003868 [Verticillium longisporum]
MGLPCSRVEAGHLHEEAFATGVRIIATDRPGMGLSTPQPDRTLLDHPKDLELLADHLKLSEYGVLGVSGGGPYALACAVSHAPERLKCVTVVCGIGPPDIGMAGAGWFHWLGFTFGWRYAPRLAAWFFKSQEQLDLPDEKRHDIRIQQAKKQDAQFPESEKDIWTNKDIAGRMVISSRQVYLQGIDGFGQDGYLLCTEFGFDIRDIRHDLPITLCIVVLHPPGGVKEQTVSIYAKGLSEREYVTVCFDAAHQGESGDFIDADRIGILGICAGGGYATAAATADYRFKAVAVVSPVNMGLGVRLGPQGQDVAAEKLSLLEQAAQARQIEAKGGEPVTVPIITPLGENPTEEALKVHDYYMTPRAQHPRSENKMLLRSLTLLANFNHGPLHTYSLRNRY